MSALLPPFGFIPPDIAAFRAGNCGVDYVATLDAPRPGPHVVINALTHGNEPCGAAAIIGLLALGVRPTRGRLTLIFANTAAYRQFSPADPFAARYLDEDFNRLWRDALLDAPGGGVERARARVLRPIYAAADVLLDLHSMASDAEALILCGRTARARALALRLGHPAWVVADDGHQAGPRLMDYAPFADPAGQRTALLVECGAHWRVHAAETALEVSLRLLALHDMLDPALLCHIPRRHARQSLVDVTHGVTAQTEHFRFAEPYVGLEVIANAGTVIGFDGEQPVTTPYDDCVLVMPTHHARSGQTAVRLGRLTPTEQGAFFSSS